MLLPSQRAPIMTQRTTPTEWSLGVSCIFFPDSSEFPSGFHAILPSYRGCLTRARATLFRGLPLLGPRRRRQGRPVRRKSRYTANTTEQMLKRMAPNTKVNTIMGQTNLNQWDIFMSSICSVAITRPVGAM